MRAPIKSLVAILAAAALAQTATLAARADDDSRIAPRDAQSPPSDESHQTMARRIDELLQQQWTTAGVEPTAVTPDGAFLRRASLDLTGVIPRAAEVREFLADERPDKRARLVERLLASPRYATHMASTWHNRIVPLGADPARMRQAMALQKWLRTRFAENLRYDNLVGGLLLAAGDEEIGPALYFQANDLAPEKLAGSAAELFLGVQLHCAQCHDHPYADWSQRDFWGLAAFFARVKAPDNARMQTVYRLVDADSGEVTLPESSEVVAPTYPGGDAAADDQRQSRRMQLVLWMTSRDNRMFSRAAVNWAWSHLFATGLVDSLDELGAADHAKQPGQGDRPANAQLLEELADYFVKSGFDLQQLWRTLAATRAYQLSCGESDVADEAASHFACMLAKPLTPEQLYDSFMQLSPAGALTPSASAAADGPPPTSLDEDPRRLEFVRRMRAPPGHAAEYRAGTLQALMLMNGPLTADATAHDRSRLLGAVAAPFMSDRAQLEAMYLATLSRPPSDEEVEICLNAVAECGTPEEKSRARADILWALVNSTEFAFNH